MVTGTFIGSVADAWGRKFCSVLYCVLYALACVTKHVNSYSVLMLGRLLGGAATSLLFSTFECWMVGEHRRCGFPDDLLRYMFGLMFFVQYLAAIGAGLLAQFAASSVPLTQVSDTVWYGGVTTPFDVSFVFLVAAIPFICYLWQENYGESSDETGGEGFAQIATSFQAGLRAMSSSYEVPLLGLAVASFESSMYAFVFNWTPALDSGSATTPPHGLIFSAFMMACMCGSSLFSLLDTKMQPVKVLIPICLAAASALGLVAVSLYTAYSELAIFLGFLAFEACVGAYFPCVSTVKSAVVPEQARAGVYNVYRVPLNLCVVLLLLADFELKDSFALCSALLVFAVFAVALIARRSE
ncbi:MFSD5 [Symbiodinium natans]|uniref:Molybdate-anion transporter n=1 Tax=Symbiodinium natans TaxID=878477 RepID=A0A812Q0M6_9DINO|nr:MFSD5 [Symbiodinium natans]